MGSDYTHLPLHCSLPGRDLRRLPYGWWSILLERNAFDQEVGPVDILGDGLVDSGGELDRDDEYQFWGSTAYLVWVFGCVIKRSQD